MVQTLPQNAAEERYRWIVPYFEGKSALQKLTLPNGQKFILSSH